MNSLLAVLALAIVHAGAGTAGALRVHWRLRALSAAAGIGVAYIFLDLIPAMAAGQEVIESSGLLSGLERHVFVMALAGLSVAFGLSRDQTKSRPRL